ncbi:hypothetical protein PGT21_011505 [Puccinia graminis f. sp. tritici]|uniref:Uncharacterized protein n=1 Tax=Puccinia graminis f. sp. tritici TaxID=56615 RepID=A0A5B0QI08_PUCGR|nr:hypothetical protein PGT21_011505 [Puccinia graminis f. sp. tritici]
MVLLALHDWVVHLVQVPPSEALRASEGGGTCVKFGSLSAGESRTLSATERGCSWSLGLRDSEGLDNWITTGTGMLNVARLETAHTSSHERFRLIEKSNEP